MYFDARQKKKMMNKSNKNINIFALTDCHQEARKLCQLFSGIIHRAPQNGRNTLICDSGDLFKGIYDRELCVESYLNLRQQLPEAKIVIGIGNNDFGFNSENLKFLQQTSTRFNQANIHVLCANLQDLETNTWPKWVDPYILLEINGHKIMVTAFCVNYIHLQKYNLQLNNITDAFLHLRDTIHYIEPDALIVLNHALQTSSAEIWRAAQENNIRIDLIIGGHEHAPVEPDAERRIYYPQAFSRNMLCFEMGITAKGTSLHHIKTVSSKSETVLPLFEKPLNDFEKRVGLNIPVAQSTLNLERRYSDFCPIGSFIADQMQSAAKADIGMISTGYITHALRYEKDKILTMYNLERVLSAPTPVQTVVLSVQQLKAVFNNAVRYRYLQQFGNTRFLQCSQNIGLVCARNQDNFGEIRQITVNNEPLLDDDGNPLHPEDEYLCAIDPFIGFGELGYEVLRALPKETLLKNNQLVRIKDLIFQAVQAAETKYAAGSSYPFAKLKDI